MSINLCNPSGLSLDHTTAISANILKDKTAYDGEGNIITGSMNNNGDISATLNPGGSKTLSEGYYSGGTINCNSASSAIHYATFNATYGANRNGDIYTYSVGNKIIGVSNMTEPTDGSANMRIYYINISGNTITYRVAGGGYPLRNITVAYI